MNEYKHFKNGNRCPCCGQVIEGKSEEWLELFSELTYLWLGDKENYTLLDERDEEETEHDKPEV